VLLVFTRTRGDSKGRYGTEEMCVHGFRATASTLLNEMGGWNADAIERQLAHREANAIRRAYTHNAEYWSERMMMMQAWADYLDGLRDCSANQSSGAAL
jgi:integrase